MFRHQGSFATSFIVFGFEMSLALILLLTNAGVPPTRWNYMGGLTGMTEDGIAQTFFTRELYCIYFNSNYWQSLFISLQVNGKIKELFN